MKNHIKISIPNPCSENWDEMQINGCGRFCASCEKTVVDFTKMDDMDFVAYFQNIKNVPCGKFTEKQLSIDIPFRSRPLLSFGGISKYVAASMIALAGLSGKVFGQQHTSIVQAPVKPNEAKKANSSTASNSTVIRGRVLDENNEGLPGASVSIPALNASIMADVDGNFEIIINNNDPKIVYYDLQVAYIGYGSKTHSINIFTHPDIVLIQFNEKELQYMGGAITTIQATNWMRFKWWVKNNLL